MDENKNTDVNNFKSSSGLVTNKNVFSCIIACIFFYILKYFWMSYFFKDVKKINPRFDLSTSKYIIISIFSFGLCDYLWIDKVTSALYEAGLNSGKNIEKHSIRNFILCYFHLDIILMGLIQKDINKFSNDIIVNYSIDNKNKVDEIDKNNAKNLFFISFIVPLLLWIALFVTILISKHSINSITLLFSIISLISLVLAFRKVKFAGYLGIFISIFCIIFNPIITYFGIMLLIFSIKYLSSFN